MLLLVTTLALSASKTMTLAFMAMIILMLWSVKTHLLKLLMSLEMLMMVNLFTLSLLIYSTSGLFISLLVYFCVSVCEASCGISVLIFLGRTSGDDNLKTIY